MVAGSSSRFGTFASCEPASTFSRILAAVRGPILGNADLAWAACCDWNDAAQSSSQLEGGAADVFGPGSGNGAAHPAVDVKSLHAKIGELTLENDFLEGALSKAGLLSARR